MEQRGIRRIAWDGARLQLWLDESIGSIEVLLDGVHFCRLGCDRGMAALDLPFSPSGAARVNVTFAIADGGYSSVPLGLAFGTRGISPASPAMALCPLADQELCELPRSAGDLGREVAIVVPVYNAADLARACLDSVLAYTTGAARLIVIDDASSDPSVAPLLARYAHLAGVSVLRNTENLGFTGTVNRGMALAGAADVVLLNADAQVAAHWLSGLRRAAYASVDSASATAVSDNAGAFSVPELERENPLPQEWTFADAARALWQHAGTAYPRLPTGNGFCMYLRRAAIDAVGDFDAQAFAEGYGEENDWSQRAGAAGWRHVIAGNVLVQHARSQSFGHERRMRLGARGMQVLRERWPDYEGEVGASLYSYERRVLDWRVRRLYASAAQGLPRPRVLLGASLSVTAVAQLEFWRLRRDGPILLLEQQIGDAWQTRDRAECGGTSPASAVGQVCARWLQSYAIDVYAVAANASLSELTHYAEILGIAIVDAQSWRDPVADVDAALRGLRSFPGRPT